MELNRRVELLLVEDTQSDVDLTIHAFKKHNLENLVHVVRDGAEALDFLFCRGAYSGRSWEIPKVVLLDLKLPKVDGLEVLRQVRADPRTALVPVVVLTSSREESDLVATYNLGANSYIVKPVDWTQFTEAILLVGSYWLLLNQPVKAHNGPPPRPKP